MRWGSALTIGVVLAVLPTTHAVAAPGVVMSSSPICTPRTIAPNVGLTVTSAPPTGSGTYTFASQAMGGAVHEVVRLPRGYTSTKRYPVLYLLHGHGGGGYLDWTRHGVDNVIGNLPLIVVMPEGGYDGFYSDWYGRDIVNAKVKGAAGPIPAWETFHIRELIPWVDATFATIASRDGRAIAGNSMGGFGAMSYAARHPDMFVAAGAFSGAVNSTLLSPVGPLVQAPAANVADQQLPDNCIWGDPVTQDTRWRDHDPTVLANSLRTVALYQRVGDGTPGRYDDFVAKQPSPGAVLNEFGIDLMNRNFDLALKRAGIAHKATFEHGIHDWPYWLDDLREFLPIATNAFAHPPPAPPNAAFAYASAASVFSVWGWTFRSDQPDETSLVQLTRVGRDGLSVRGTGTLRVDTAALFTPGRAYVINGTKQKADATGRLHTTVTLSSTTTRVRIVAQ